MATITTSSSNSISNITGYKFEAECVYGDNGDGSGQGGYDIGTSPSNNNSGEIVWQPTEGQAFNTGNIAVTLDAPKGGGSGNPPTWTVSGSEDGPVNYSVSYGAIQSAEIRAGVTLAGTAISFNDLVLKFYKNGSLIETVNLSSADNPSVNALSSSGTVAMQQLTTVTPANNNNDSVVITGNMVLQANNGVYPGATNMFDQIFVFTL
jgi:hypothetical protein